MKNYLSFGGGVNSVAMEIMMIREGIEHESIFVDHGADWPETYEYFDMFQDWLKKKGHRLVTVIPATVTRRGKTWHSLFDFCRDRKRIPQQWPRWCTGDWKKDQVHKYVEKPCFMMIGIDSGEESRAKIVSKGKIEYRYPLIEYGIDREECKEIILSAGLPVPPKSGCFICPFQKRSGWIKLRKEHPCLFQKAVELENASGRTFNKRMSLSNFIDENQINLFPDIDDYPPCECGL